MIQMRGGVQVRGTGDYQIAADRIARGDSTFFGRDWRRKQRGRSIGENAWAECGCGVDDRPGLGWAGLGRMGLDWTEEYQDIKRADRATARAARPGGREPDVRGRDADGLDPNSTGYIRARMEARCVGSYER